MLVDLNSRTGPSVGGMTIHNDSSAARKWIKRDEEDSVRLYLTDIGQYPLLTEGDEVRLAQDIEAGMAARRELENPDSTLTPARKRKLRKALRKGEESERTFIQSNLRLVVSIAKKYQASGLPLLDLIQEGNLGLMHAVEKFDWRKRSKFSIYATKWIRQAITRGIANTCRTIRLPGELGDMMEEYFNEEKEEQRFRLLAKEQGHWIEARPVSTGFTEATDDWGDGEAALTHAESVTDSVRQKIRSVLASVSHTEKLIIEHRLFSKSKTLDELGRLSGLSRERIRQLEKKLIKDQVIEESIGAEINMIAHNLTRQIDPVVATIELDSWITSIFYDKNVCDLESRLARSVLKKRLNYKCMRGIYINSAAVKIVKKFEKTAVQLADDVGLIDKEALQNCLPSSEWDKFFSALVDCCGFYQVSGQLAIRETSKAKVKAALLEIGRTATKDEIASIAGLDPGRVSGQLSSITSIARADKTRWGLTEWIDDIYEGIPAEIVQRIKEDGGFTTLDRLLDELPRQFNVSESSVRTYVGTPQFISQDGIVRLRQPHETYSYDDSDIRNTPGVFALGTGRVSLLYKVDRDVFRGSGRKLTMAAGKILDLAVNEQLRFTGPDSTIVTISFPESSPAGPSLGSTRALADITEAKLGNLLTVTFDRIERKVTAISTDPTEHPSGWSLVARLTGIDERSGMDGLADALNCAHREVRATLRKRGDSVVLDALPLQPPSNDLAKALAELDAEMERSRS